MQKIKRLIGWLVVGGLLTALFYLLAERNQRSWSLESHGNELLVMRGRFFPVGMQPFRSADRAQSLAYAPLSLYGPLPAELRGKIFTEREEFDRALFRMLTGWASARVDSNDGAKLTEALRLVQRAGLLSSISEEQRRELAELQGRLAWFEGKAQLDEATETLRQAVSRLRLASEARGRQAREASALYERVAPLAEQLAEAVRQPASAKAPAPAAPAAAEAPAK